MLRFLLSREAHEFIVGVRTHTCRSIRVSSVRFEIGCGGGGV